MYCAGKISLHLSICTTTLESMNECELRNEMASLLNMIAIRDSILGSCWLAQRTQVLFLKQMVVGVIIFCWGEAHRTWPIYNYFCRKAISQIDSEGCRARLWAEVDEI